MFHSILCRFLSAFLKIYWQISMCDFFFFSKRDSWKPPTYQTKLTSWEKKSHFATIHQSFWNSSDLSDLGGRKWWGLPITSVMPVHMSDKHFWMMFTFLTEVGNAGHIINTRISSVNSEFVTALNTWYFICFW